MIRYGVAAALPAADLERLRASGQIEFIAGEVDPADLGSRYDVIMAYGLYPDAAMSPVTAQVMLVVNDQRSPLNDLALVSIIRRALHSPTLVDALDIPGAQSQPAEQSSRAALRTELANAGWPDGFDLMLAHADIPGSAQVAEQLGAIGIYLTPVPLTDTHWENSNLVMTTERAIWVERVGEANIIDLFTLPISFWTVDGLNIAFTPGGWPVVQR